jgi:hypothetical protein
MISDINRGIESGLNYLVALGLSTYTEVLGGLCFGNLKSNHEANYLRFIKRYFHCEYLKINKRLRHLGGLYGIIRSGLVHRYLFQKNSFVATYATGPLNCAILYDPVVNPSITFVVNQYFMDFKKAFDQYNDELILKADPFLIKNFDKAVTEVKLV